VTAVGAKIDRSESAPSPLRILQIHKFFYPHAGSETALFHTRKLLFDHGHEVIDFSMRHPRNVDSPYSRHFAPERDYVDPSRPLSARARDALNSIYSVSARKSLRGLLEQVRPDVVHMHLIYHQLSLSLIDEIAAQGIPSVMTLHDYKIGCPAYTLFRDGKPCELCVGGPVENALRHRCVKGSTAASLLATVEARLARARGTYRKVDGYIAPSAFAGRVATATGIDPETVHVIPNFLPDEEIGAPVAALAAEPRFFFAGRLEALKGVREILDAFRSGGSELGTLVVAGAGGELEDEVRTAAGELSNVEYLGRVSRDEVFAQLRQARALLMPVRWHENNPMSLLEARAVGIPVICTPLGGLPEMVDDQVDGLIVPREEPAALREALRRLAGDRDLAQTMGQRGAERLRRDNTASAHYRALIAAYRMAIGHRGAGAAPRSP
jgi:glycosyltransferase involved in cell wall biosynthesis